jgi:threonine synthase
MKMGIIRKFRQFFADIDESSIVSLGEGDTPMIFAPKVAGEIGFCGQLYFKYEGANPTGSFKDRGMTTAVSKSMREESVEGFVCASTGNTGAAAAAYGAEARAPVWVLVPAGGIAEGKRVQILAYGAKIIEINGNFDACQDIVRRINGECSGIVVLNNTHPYRLPGQRTAAFEILDELGRAPDYHFIPVGNAGNITAYWMGYKEYSAYWSGCDISAQMAKWGRRTPEGVRKLPRMMGYQAEGAAPIVRGYAIGNPKTIASAINIGNPARWKEAEEAVLESEGRFDMVSDEEIMRFHGLIAKLCPQAACEPSSAVSVAGLAKAIWRQEIENNEDTVVVCTLTGAWWKDQDVFKGKSRRRTKAVDPDFGIVVKLLK